MAEEPTFGLVSELELHRSAQMVKTGDAAVKALREKHPDTKFVYQLHDYDHELRIMFEHRHTRYYDAFRWSDLVKLQIDPIEHVVYRVTEHVLFARREDARGA